MHKYVYECYNKKKINKELNINILKIFVINTNQYIHSINTSKPILFINKPLNLSKKIT